MSTMEAIIRTAGEHLEATARADAKALQAHIDNGLAAIADADRAHHEGLQEVRRLQRQAAEIYQESLKLAEEVHDAHMAARRAEVVHWADIRPPNAERSPKPMRAISRGGPE